MDYRMYQYSKNEVLEYSAVYLVLDGMISYLFYQSWIVFLLLLPGIVFFLREKKKTLIKKRKQQLRQQFLTAVRAVSTALNAGYSVENAFLEALKEMKKIYEPKDMIVLELQWIAGQMQMNRTLESLLLDLGKRSDEEDIRNFAEIFQVAKRSGGDLLAVIRNTIHCISQKQDAKREIAVAIAAKKTEQTVMSVIPCFILLYIRTASPGFLDSMYHNGMGICIMTMCLAAYLGACFWAGKIVDIEV